MLPSPMWSRLSQGGATRGSVSLAAVMQGARAVTGSRDAGSTCCPPPFPLTRAAVLVLAACTVPPSPTRPASLPLPLTIPPGRRHEGQSVKGGSGSRGGGSAGSATAFPAQTHHWGGRVCVDVQGRVFSLTPLPIVIPHCDLSPALIISPSARLSPSLHPCFLLCSSRSDGYTFSQQIAQLPTEPIEA
ncbi:unnamed protein product [Closterium sp. Naga37s-1]|nr:unnamed protein product [Closterium sp. Naga37s-1]